MIGMCHLIHRNSAGLLPLAGTILAGPKRAGLIASRIGRFGANKAPKHIFDCTFSQYTRDFHIREYL